jgi:predicted amidohydrolase
VTGVDGGFEGRLRLRIEQFAPVLGDVDANLGRIAGSAADADDDDVDLLLTPELSLTGYDLRDLVHEVARPMAAGAFAALAGGPDVVLGMVERGDDSVPYNAAVHLRAGEILHRHRKVYLPTYGMFDEGRYFGRGDRARVYDAGGGWKIGILVCEDLWHPSLVYLLAVGGANLLLVQSASAGRGAWDGRPGGRFASWSAWKHIACAAAVSYGIYVVLANRVGVEGSSVFGGGSMIVDPTGKVVSRADDLAEDRITAELDVAAVAAARRPFAHARDEDPLLVVRELERLAADGS